MSRIFTDVKRVREADLPFGRPMKCDHCGQLIATKRITFQDVMIGDAGQINLLLRGECANIDSQKVVAKFLAHRDDAING